MREREREKVLERERKREKAIFLFCSRRRNVIFRPSAAFQEMRRS